MTVEEPGELFAVAEEKLDLETRNIEVYQFMPIQIRISRAQYDETRLGRVFPIEEDDNTQATLKRLVPHHGGIQMHMRLIFSCAEIFKTAQVLEVDLPVIFAPCPTALRVRAGVEKHAVSVAPQFGDGMQIEADDFINIFLLRIVAVHTMILDTRRQAMPMRTQLLLVEVDPGFFQLSLRGILSRRRLRTGESKSAPACDIHHRECGNSSPRSARLAQPLKKCPRPNVCLPLLEMKDAS